MRRFLLGRLAQSALVIVVVATITFFLIDLAPGDPFAAALEHPSISEAVRRQWRAQFGLDRPLPEQYVRYVSSVLRGDFGWSLSLKQPVADVLARAIPTTLVLMATAVGLSFVLGVALGVLQAVRRGSLLDRVLSAISLFFYSMPDFWLAIMAIVFLAYRFPLFPVTGTVDAVMYPYMGPWEKLVDRLHHLALPAMTLTALTMAFVARYQRSAMLDVVHQDYVRTARAKGLTDRRVIMRHALRNALLPVITLFGLAFPALVGGAVFVEKVFAWPGMGLVAVSAINSRDYPLVTATVIVASAMVALGSLLADVLYAAVDPRLRDA